MSSVTVPGGTVTNTVADPAAEKRVLLANYLSKVDPQSLLLRLGVVSSTEPTTRQVTDSLPPQTVTLHGRGSKTPSVRGGGVANFEGKKVAAWIAPALQYARQHGWKGTVTSGYRSYADQQRIYNSGVRPAAKPGTSNHEGTQFPRGAVDATDPQTLARILLNSKYRKLLVYAGSKDPVHFSHPHNGSY